MNTPDIQSQSKTLGEEIFNKYFCDHKYIFVDDLGYLNYKKYKYITDDILTKLFYCDCCLKHQINKPAIFMLCPKYECHFTQLEDDDCHCPCRHLSRDICRLCDD